MHRGPTVSLGYWKRPEDTARVLRPNPLLPAAMGQCELVCYSGDLVKMDEDGFLYFVGRRDTMIKSSGFRISPTAGGRGALPQRAGEGRRGDRSPRRRSRLSRQGVRRRARRWAGRRGTAHRVLRGSSSALHGSQARRGTSRRCPRPPAARWTIQRSAATSRAEMAGVVGALIEQNFGASGGELVIDGVPITQLAARHGTPAFFYSRRVVEQQIRRLRRAVPEGFHICYSIKANPSRALLEIFLSRDCGLEIASAGEFHQALAANASPADIIFAGPGKTEAELELVLKAGIGEIHAESEREIRRIGAIAGRLGSRARVAVRVNPGAEAQGGAMRMGGKPLPFGVDEERLDEVLGLLLEQPAIEFRGIHLFAGTQILEAEVLVGQYRTALDIARRAAEITGHPVKTVDFGGGLGIPYFENDRALDLEALRTGLGSHGRVRRRSSPRRNPIHRRTGSIPRRRSRRSMSCVSVTSKSPAGRSS